MNPEATRGWWTRPERFPLKISQSGEAPPPSGTSTFPATIKTQWRTTVSTTTLKMVEDSRPPWLTPQNL